MSEKKCSTDKLVITKKIVLEEIQDDEKLSPTLISQAEDSIYCHICRKKMKLPSDSNDVLENDGDYFLCIACQRESPTCESCGEKSVEPDDDGNWKNTCISC
jgi:hypothetical protein